MNTGLLALRWYSRTAQFEVWTLFQNLNPVCDDIRPSVVKNLHDCFCINVKQYCMQEPAPPILNPATTPIHINNNYKNDCSFEPVEHVI